MSRLDTIPKSHRRFFIKKVTQLPSGDRNDPQILKEPWYYIMDRPVNPKGEKDRWYGTKTKSVGLPFVGEVGKAKAEEIVRLRNEAWHN